MPLHIPKPKKIRADFFTTIGDDIKVAVQGESCARPVHIGESSEYIIYRVWVESDLEATNLLSSLDYSTYLRIKAEGRKHFEQKHKGDMK